MIASVLALSFAWSIQNGPVSKAEATAYKETSSYADVVKFLDELKATGAPIDIRSSGKSTEGRSIPLVIAARPMVKTPEEAAKSGKLIVYIQANIHAGEVEGKEAALSLLRKYCQDKHGILDKAILLVQPIYNCDGNEKFAPQARNRPGQNGPEMVGVRYNGQNLDLNRDCMKAESPEMQGVLSSIYSWNPHAMFDLHTTDGTRHGYQLTYSGPLNPNTNPMILQYANDELLPSVRKSMRAKYKKEIFDYGNGVNEQGKWRFETFGGEPRYVTNYAGLRNIIPILSESVVYETFEDRVKDTEHFVDECMQKLVRDSKRIQSNKKKIESAMMSWNKPTVMAPALATRYEMASRGEEDVLLEKDLASGGRRSGPVRNIESIKMPVFDRFDGKKLVPVPAGYILPESATDQIAKLKMHGIIVSRLEQSKLKSSQVQSFRITKFDQARSAFQGHKLITLDGDWFETQVPTQGFVVWLDQPLGLLAFEMLEPDCIDGLSAWGSFGETFTVGSHHPVLRVFLTKATKPVGISLE